MKKSSRNQNLIDFSKKLLTNEDCEYCLEYFKKIRWKRGFVCPYCGKKPCWTIAPYKYKCRNCGRQTTVTSGTFFHRTHLTMPQWFNAIYYCCKEGDGATAKGLKSDADIGSYRIALKTLEKIKLRIYRIDKYKPEWTDSPLDGDVKIWSEKIPVNNTHIEIIIAVEYNDKKTGRIRIIENKKILRTKEIKELLKSEYTTPDSNIDFDLSCTEKILKDFTKWCKGQKENDFTELSRSYCQMYNTTVLFNNVLENMIKP